MFELIFMQSMYKKLNQEQINEKIVFIFNAF